MKFSINFMLEILNTNRRKENSKYIQIIIQKPPKGNMSSFHYHSFVFTKLQINFMPGKYGLENVISDNIMHIVTLLSFYYYLINHKLLKTFNAISRQFLLVSSMFYVGNPSVSIISDYSSQSDAKSSRFFR